MATTATSPPSVRFSVRSVEELPFQLGGEGPIRRRFDVRARNDALPGATFNLVFEAVTSSAPQPLIRYRVDHGVISELLGGADLRISEGEILTVELEARTSSTQEGLLRVTASFSQIQEYSGEPPPAPAWTESEFDIQMDVLPPPSAALNDALPPRPGPLPLRAGGEACREPHRPDESIGAGQTRVRAPTLVSAGAIVPGATVRLRMETEETFGRAFIGPYTQPVTIDRGELELIVPPVAGPVDVVIIAHPHFAVARDLFTVASALVPTAELWPEDRFVDATGNSETSWVATASGRVGRLVGGRLEPVARSFAGVHDLALGRSGLWVATSSRVYRASLLFSANIWPSPVVDMDARRIELLGEGGHGAGTVVLAGRPAMVGGAATGGRFSSRAAPFVGIDFDVDECEPSDAYALGEAGELWSTADGGASWRREATLPDGFQRVARSSQAPQMVFLAGPESSLAWDRETGVQTGGPPITRFGKGASAGLYGAGPRGLWWRTGGRWRQVASWLEASKIFELSVNENGPGVVSVFTSRGRINVGIR